MHTGRKNCQKSTQGAKGEPGLRGLQGLIGPSGGLFTVDYYTANDDGIQSTAVLLISTDNIFNVDAVVNAAGKLNPAIKNESQQVRNYTANNIRVYPRSGDQIIVNGVSLGVNAFYLLAPGAVRTFACAVDGTFET